MTDLPIMRKDFVVTAHQVLEARAYGADAVLLIVAALDGPVLRELMGLARELGMDALVEVHSEQEVTAALDAGARLVGVNHRDMATFEVDVGDAVNIEVDVFSKYVERLIRRSA